MLEHIAIQNTITRYCDAVTRRDWILLAKLFAPDATWDVVGKNANFHFAGNGVVPGIRGIVESTGFIVQINSPAIIDVNELRATARTIMYELGGTADGLKRFEEPGIYDDVLEKTGGEWKFKSRRFSILHFQMDRIESSDNA